MSYEKSLEMKVVRTKHVVSFYSGSLVCDILNDFCRVPPEARVVDFKTTEDGDNHHMIVFEVEEKIKE